MTDLCLRHVLFLDFSERELNCVVAVILDRLLLCHRAGAGFNNGHRYNASVFKEDLGHTELLANNAFFHFLLQLLVDVLDFRLPDYANLTD